MAQEAAGDADHANDANDTDVANAIRKCRPVHQGQGRAQAGLGGTCNTDLRQSTPHWDHITAARQPLHVLARRVLEQERRQRGRKVYSLHAPEVECIGKGKAHQPYESGVKVSVATTVKRPPVHYFRPEPPGSPRREAMEPFSAGALRACIPRSVGRERLL
jgi:hypothetical protein